MTGESLTLIQDQLEKLKQLFPEAITEGKIDWEKLQSTLGKDNIEFLNERYVLNWAGKSDAFKVLQQSTTATLLNILIIDLKLLRISDGGTKDFNLCYTPCNRSFVVLSLS